MSKPKRLFLFAAYDAHGCVDNSLLHYVHELATLGDVVLFMDADSNESEIKKLSPCVLYAGATRHGEYDFGSYKRAYIYAADNKLLKNYDYLYLVNDSVYGPLHKLEPQLIKMESLGVDAFGLVKNPHHEHPHIQSWFIGCDKNVFMTSWFDKFMKSVTHQRDKGMVTKIYEQGFTQLVENNNCTWRCLYSIPNRGIYNRIKHLYRAGMPFMKKNAFSRHGGVLGRQIAYVLRHLPRPVCDAILENARRTYGDEYIGWLLTRNPVKIMYRGIKYATKKILTRGL